VQQQIAEKHLKQRELDLEAREMELLRWELNIIMQQQQRLTIPTPNKRHGHFKKSNILKMLKKPDQLPISSPSGSLKSNNFKFKLLIINAFSRFSAYNYCTAYWRSKKSRIIWSKQPTWFS